MFAQKMLCPLSSSGTSHYLFNYHHSLEYETYCLRTTCSLFRARYVELLCVDSLFTLIERIHLVCKFPLKARNSVPVCDAILHIYPGLGLACVSPVAEEQKKKKKPVGVGDHTTNLPINGRLLYLLSHSGHSGVGLILDSFQIKWIKINTA